MVVDAHEYTEHPENSASFPKDFKALIKKKKLVTLKQEGAFLAV